MSKMKITDTGGGGMSDFLLEAARANVEEQVRAMGLVCPKCGPMDIKVKLGPDQGVIFQGVCCDEGERLVREIKPA